MQNSAGLEHAHADCANCTWLENENHTDEEGTWFSRLPGGILAILVIFLLFLNVRRVMILILFE